MLVYTVSSVLCRKNTHRWYASWGIGGSGRATAAMEKDSALDEKNYFDDPKDRTSPPIFAARIVIHIPNANWEAVITANAVAIWTFFNVTAYILRWNFQEQTQSYTTIPDLTVSTIWATRVQTLNVKIE
jgi:hypothetical protein